MALLAPSCALGSAVAWSIGSIGYSKLAKNHSIFSVNFSRALVSLPLFICAVIIASGGFTESWINYKSVEPSHWGWFAVSIFSSYGLGDAAFFWSTSLLGIPAAMAIASIYPIWTLFLGSYLMGEHVSHLQVSGVLICLVGVILVVLTPDRSLESPARRPQASPLLGLGLALLTSLFWSLNSYSVAKGGAGVLTPVGNSIRMAIALLLTAVLGKCMSPGELLILPLVQVRRFFWVFVLESFVGSYLYVYGMSHASFSIASTLSALAPVISVPLAVISGTEKFSFVRTFGVCLVVVGVCLLVGF